jgi:asparagine synthase (glutamine-hydrolysing)
LRADVVERLELRRRYEESLAPRLDPESLRPEATAQLGGPEWSFSLESYDAGMNELPLDYRHPFLDLRLVEFLLALPVVPWLVEKEILRRCMRARLPATTLARRKAPLAANPVHRILLASAEEIAGLARDVDRLAQFIDVTRFKRIAERPERLHEWEYGLVTRPLGLALWLRRLQATEPSRKREDLGEPDRSARQKAIS